MEKLKRYSINECFKHLFFLLIALVPLSILNSVIHFYDSPFHSDLLKNYVIIDLLENLLFFLPAFFISALSYTVNISFPDNEIEKYSVAEIMTFIIEFSFVFIFIIIFLIEMLSTTLIYKKEKFLIKDKIYKSRDMNRQVITKLKKKADLLIEDGEYYKALEKLQEILILWPGYEIAEERIKDITKLLLDKKIKTLKVLKKTGVRLFEEKKYASAIDRFQEYLMIEPEDKDVLKYLNLSLQQTNLYERRYIKDQYEYKITLDKDNQAIIEYKSRIIDLINQGKKELKRNNLGNAKNVLKKVLTVDINNFDALYYLSKVNQKINQIKYFTNRSDKLIQQNCNYKTKKYILQAKELRKAKNNDYIFYNTTFYDLNKKYKMSKKFGYYDYKKKRFLFINDLFKKREPIYIDDINPDIIWYYNDIIKDPERFSTFRLVSFYKYFINNINQNELFKKLVIIKVNFYVFIIFLFINFLFLFFYFRRRVQKKGFSIYSFIFPPISAILIHKLFFFCFHLLKRILLVSSQLYPILLFINSLFYIAVFMMFFLLFQLSKHKELKKS